jgi:hypothetical protein
MAGDCRSSASDRLRNSNVFELPGNTQALQRPRMFDRGRLDHLGLRASSTDSFREIRRRLMDADASDGFVTDFGPVLSVFFVDPDGLEAEVCVENPDSQQGCSTLRAPRPRAWASEQQRTANSRSIRRDTLLTVRRSSCVVAPGGGNAECLALPDERMPVWAYRMGTGGRHRHRLARRRAGASATATPARPRRVQRRGGDRDGMRRPAPAESAAHKAAISRSTTDAASLALSWRSIG